MNRMGEKDLVVVRMVPSTEGTGSDPPDRTMGKDTTPSSKANKKKSGGGRMRSTSKKRASHRRTQSAAATTSSSRKESCVPPGESLNYHNNVTSSAARRMPPRRARTRSEDTTSSETSSECRVSLEQHISSEMGRSPTGRAPKKDVLAMSLVTPATESTGIGTPLTKNTARSNRQAKPSPKPIKKVRNKLSPDVVLDKVPKPDISSTNPTGGSPGNTYLSPSIRISVGDGVTAKGLHDSIINSLIRQRQSEWEQQQKQQQDERAGVAIPASNPPIQGLAPNSVGLGVPPPRPSRASSAVAADALPSPKTPEKPIVPSKQKIQSTPAKGATEKSGKAKNRTSPQKSAPAAPPPVEKSPSHPAPPKVAARAPPSHDNNEPSENLRQRGASNTRNSIQVLRNDWQEYLEATQDDFAVCSDRISFLQRQLHSIQHLLHEQRYFKHGAEAGMAGGTKSPSAVARGSLAAGGVGQGPSSTPVGAAPNGLAATRSLSQSLARTLSHSRRAGSLQRSLEHPNRHAYHHSEADDEVSTFVNDDLGTYQDNSGLSTFVNDDLNTVNDLSTFVNDDLGDSNSESDDEESGSGGETTSSELETDASSAITDTLSALGNLSMADGHGGYPMDKRLYANPVMEDPSVAPPSLASYTSYVAPPSLASSSICLLNSDVEDDYGDLTNQFLFYSKNPGSLLSNPDSLLGPAGRSVGTNSKNTIDPLASTGSTLPSTHRQNNYAATATMTSF